MHGAHTADLRGRHDGLPVNVLLLALNSDAAGSGGAVEGDIARLQREQFTKAEPAPEPEQHERAQVRWHLLGEGLHVRPVDERPLARRGLTGLSTWQGFLGRSPSATAVASTACSSR